MGGRAGSWRWDLLDMARWRHEVWEQRDAMLNATIEQRDAIKDPTREVRDEIKDTMPGATSTIAPLVNERGGNYWAAFEGSSSHEQHSASAGGLQGGRLLVPELSFGGLSNRRHSLLVAAAAARALNRCAQLNPQPKTMNPSPETLHPKIETLDSRILHDSKGIPKYSTLC